MEAFTGETQLWSENTSYPWWNCSNRSSSVFYSTWNKKKKEDRRFEEKEKAFFDTEYHEDEDDEPIEETLTDLLFFDFECRQENGMHESNLCIVQNEAGNEWIFGGDTTQNDFCEWLFTPEHTGCTIMAHNF